MWFEIIPAFVIVSAAIAAPHGIAYIANYLVVGNCFRRSMVTSEERLQYLRDRRMTGNPYKVSGLERLPEGDDDDDECDDKSNVEEHCEEEAEEDCKEE